MTSPLTPHDLRLKIRDQEIIGPTSGLCPGFVQANMTILPKSVADDFEQFCRQNSKPCPLLERLEPGEYRTKLLTPNDSDVDIRSDIPKYRIYRNGTLVEEVHDIRPFWREDLVTFFIGCSFSFENALMKHGVPVRNIDEKKNVSMYKTKQICSDAGVFKNVPMVVSMRPVHHSKVDRFCKITKFFADTHGDPVYCGWDFERELGIKDITKPDFGDAVTVNRDAGDVPCFTACGVTGIMAGIAAGTDLCITHSPGHMLVTDIPEPHVVLEGEQ